MINRLSAVLAAIILSAGGFAQAQPISVNGDTVAVTARIRVGDLNLRSPQDRAILDRRIARSSRRACTNQDRPLAQVDRRCLAELTTLANARANTLIARAGSVEVVAVR